MPPIFINSYSAIPLNTITTTITTMKCSFCEYEWEPRKPDPKACPRCKRRLDFPRKAKEVDLLSGAKSIERGFERTTYVMSLITPMLEKEGVQCVVVGGSAVEFYTRDWYATGDIDLAINRSKRDVIDKVMDKFGFKKEGRMWVREDLNLYIETPGDVRDIDLERTIQVETDAGYVLMIGLEDIILDRILAAGHWNSESDKEQAIRIATIYNDEIDWNYIKKVSKQEMAEKMFKIILEAVKDARK